MLEIEIEVAERHVREGARHIARQHEIIRDLTALGAPLELAIELLNLFEDMQATHIAHLERLQSSD